MFFRPAAILVTVLAALQTISAAPVAERRNTLSKRVFKELAYKDFQISSGNAGDALAKANAVFVKPFQGLDLAKVSAADLAAVKAMREAAESAETDKFNPAITKAGGTKTPAGAALQNGKIQNKVLKLVGIIQASQIAKAQAKAAGKATASFDTTIADETKKLNNNIALDKKAAGKASTAVV